MAHRTELVERQYGGVQEAPLDLSCIKQEPEWDPDGQARQAYGYPNILQESSWGQASSLQALQEKRSR
ncbi:MAG: hypothetical protein GY816_04040, partial [Cytophagales bacterium]|nr:hypothetical protein [Cytophagales bacterium]